MDKGAQTLQKMMKPIGGGAAPTQSQAGLSLDVALGKTARQMFDVDASIDDLVQTDQSLQSLLEMAPVPGLQVVVVAADGRKGLLCLDGLLINALVELMTGASDRAVFREARVPTLIDTALCREFCQSLLDGFPEEFASATGQPLVPPLSWGDTEIEAVKVVFSLENEQFLTLRGRVNLQNGIRGGEITLALPQSIWIGGTAVAKSGEDAGWSAQLKANVLAAPMVLRAGLQVVHMPLSQALALRPGDYLEIAPSSLSNLELTTREGVALLNGRLGQKDGKKAVLVTRSPEGVAGPILQVTGIAPPDQDAATPPPEIGLIPPGLSDAAPNEDENPQAFDAMTQPVSDL